MVSAGQDKNLGVWDLRMMREVNSYFLRKPGSSLSISDRDLVGVGWGTQTSIWKVWGSNPRDLGWDSELMI